MKIAQIHNKYTELGGEDVVVNQEKTLLENAGHTVVQFLVSNEDYNTLTSRFALALAMPYSIKMKQKITKFLKKFDPDVVHAHNFLPILSPAIFYVCKSLDYPVVVTIHNFRLICINGLLYRKGHVCEKCITKSWPLSGIKYGCYQDSKAVSVFPTLTNGIHNLLGTWKSKVDVFIFLSEFSKKVFDRSHISIAEEKVFIKPNFVPDNGFSFEKENYYLFAGRLTEEKGVLFVVNAFKKNGKELRIAGSGPLEDKLRDIAVTHKNIQVLGFQDKAQMRTLYLGAKATIFTSKMYENNPLVIIESFSFGTPVITSDFGNAGVLVNENHNGNKYKLDNEKSLFEVIRDFEENSNKISLRKGARSTFEENFSINKNLAMLENIYRYSMENKLNKPKL